MKEYASEQDCRGIPSFIANQMPLKVVTTTMAYGHLGIFFNACGVKGVEHDQGMRHFFLELIEKQLVRSGHKPKVRSRISPTQISRFTLTITPQPMLCDGVYYALTDDYALRQDADTPHALSIGFFNRTKSSSLPRPLTLAEIKDYILLNRSGKWNWPYDNEIKCAYLRTSQVESH